MAGETSNTHTHILYTVEQTYYVYMIICKCACVIVFKHWPHPVSKNVLWKGKTHAVGSRCPSHQENLVASSLPTRAGPAIILHCLSWTHGTAVFERSLDYIIGELFTFVRRWYCVVDTLVIHGEGAIGSHIHEPRKKLVCYMVVEQTCCKYIWNRPEHGCLHPIPHCTQRAGIYPSSTFLLVSTFDLFFLLLTLPQSRRQGKFLIWPWDVGLTTKVGQGYRKTGANNEFFKCITWHGCVWNGTL